MKSVMNVQQLRAILNDLPPDGEVLCGGLTTLHIVDAQGTKMIGMLIGTRCGPLVHIKVDRLLLPLPGEVGNDPCRDERGGSGQQRRHGGYVARLALYLKEFAMGLR